MTDDFLLSYVSFDDKNQPFVDIETDGEIKRVPSLGLDFNYEFDLSTRFCTGWIDFENKVANVCPSGATVDAKYENCLECRNKTGFNPAFYNASSISEQQEKINQNEHFVYLAYFSPEVIKVGISQESRGLRRLLEQGSRVAMKLETFPSANVARQYEERISNLPNVVDNVTGSRKLNLLSENFNIESAKKSLTDLQETIENSLKVNFENAKIIETENYFGDTNQDFEKAIDMTDNQNVAGDIVASIGAIIITKYGENLLKYNLKKYVGYKAKKTEGDLELDLPTEQLTLF